MMSVIYIKVFQKKTIGVKSSLCSIEVWYSLSYSLQFSVYLKTVIMQSQRHYKDPRNLVEPSFINSKYISFFFWDKSQNHSLQTGRIVRLFQMYRNWWPQNWIDLSQVTKQVICRNSSNLNACSFLLVTSIFLRTDSYLINLCHLFTAPACILSFAIHQ